MRAGKPDQGTGGHKAPAHITAQTGSTVIGTKKTAIQKKTGGRLGFGFPGPAASFFDSAQSSCRFSWPMSNGFQRRANLRFAVLLCSRLAGWVILRQVRGLNPAAGLPVVLVVGVAVAAVPVLAALFFVRGPVPWPGSLRRSWPCCRLSSAWFCCWSLPVRIAPPGSLWLWSPWSCWWPAKSRAGRVIRGPGWFRLAPGLLSARSCPAAAPPGAGRVILRQVPGLDPAAGLLVVLVVLFFALGPAAGRRRRGPAGCRPCGSPPGSRWPCPSPWSCWWPAKSRAGRVIRGPGCFTWRRAWCRIAGGVAGVAWWLPGDPPAAAGPRSGVRAPGGPGRRGRCGCPGGSLLCPWSSPLARLAAPFLALLSAVVGVFLPAAARADRRRAPGGRGPPGRACGWQIARRPGDPRPGWFHLVPGLLSARSCRSRPGVLHLVPGLVPDRRRRCRCSPGAGRVILRQLRGLDPAAGLPVVLVVGVAVAAVPVLVVLFFARGPVPWPGWLRCSWPCCRPSPVCSCRLPPVRIAAGVVVSVGAFVGALVGLVAFKEQGGRVIRGRCGSTWRRACCPPGRADLGPGCSTWCRIAGGVAGVRLGWPGDPPAAAGPRSGGRAAGGRGRCACPGRSLLCPGPLPWPCSLRRSWWPCCPVGWSCCPVGWSCCPVGWSCWPVLVLVAAGVVVPAPFHPLIRYCFRRKIEGVQGSLRRGSRRAALVVRGSFQGSTRTGRLTRRV